jgi:hypothetical protein
MSFGPLSNASSNDTSIDPHARRDDVIPDFDPKSAVANSPGYDNLQHPKPKPALTRHYTSFQEQTDQLQVVQTTEEENGSTPRQYDNRLDGFS